MELRQTGPIAMESEQMKMLEMMQRKREIMRTQVAGQAQCSCISAFVAGRLKLIWRSLAVGARSKRKTLSVCASVALGDRRFASVVQFERQRFLIGSSPSSVALLAHLPDEPASDEANTKEIGERN
jgi:flagellar biogenesis protein FliO